MTNFLNYWNFRWFFYKYSKTILSYIKINKIAYFDIEDLDMAKQNDKRNFRQLIRILMNENVITDIKKLENRDYLVIEKPKMVTCPTYSEFMINEKENHKSCEYTENAKPEKKVVAANVVYVDFNKKSRIS